jgi:hypothetical protein
LSFSLRCRVFKAQFNGGLTFGASGRAQRDDRFQPAQGLLDLVERCVQCFRSP